MFRSLSNVQLYISCCRCPLELPRFGPVCLAGPPFWPGVLKRHGPWRANGEYEPPLVLLLRLVREALLCRRRLETVRPKAGFKPLCRRVGHKFNG